MGQDIARSRFDESDHAEFRARLRDETKTLKRWFEEKRFEQSDIFRTGLELEAWLVDENFLPTPSSDEFIATANDPHVVHELSKFNFELNADPHDLKGRCFATMRGDLDNLWQRCTHAAETLRQRPVAIGILPTVRDEMLQPTWMSDLNRYKALNDELFRARQSEPFHIEISGQDELDYRCDHIMLEAACTSLQAHLQINQDDAVRFYNASLIAAAPLIAATANSPFLYGKSLWAETRIPAFEQATKVHGFHDLHGRQVLRVTLGMGYLRHSFLELFLENLSYPILLPIVSEDGDRFRNLRLQNGTIWRWVRPIIGFDEADAPHLRIEHRVMPSGPTIADTIANLMLCFGLMLDLGRAETPPETETGFEDCRANFYACARDGLNARICWAGQSHDVRTLLLEKLLPDARRALARVGVDAADLDYYFDEILHPRVASGLIGAEWQRRYYSGNGRNFQALTERYAELQSGGTPVHSWPI